DYLGGGPDTLKDLVEGTHAFADLLKNSAKPMIIIGQGALSRTDGAGVLASAAKLAGSFGAVAEGWNGFAVLHTAASRVGGIDALGARHKA
ncbi:molybdopterin-dependent oxidoreductase, partial [Rhizobium leguminosarum]|uniref:molybdopterin-dependent oxidoreductase n=1 Tax=Rhizobium leguminosarum TaxID=384 RepID=UPI003F9EB71D